MHIAIYTDCGMEVKRMCDFDLTIKVPMRTNPYMGSSTEYNLWQAYVGESMASNRYLYYASVARKAGYEYIAAAFEKIAANEKEHAKIWFKELNQIGSLSENLGMTAQGENHECTSLYPRMAEEAYNEGFNKLGKLFEAVAKIEHHHECVFRDLIYELETDSSFQKSGLVVWECRNCGHIELAEAAPLTCPVCDHPQAFFQAISRKNNK